MDPLSAVSLAGTVVQFVDFGSRLVFKTIEITRSADGVLLENSTIATATKDLSQLTGKLKSDVQIAGDAAQKAGDNREIEKCKALAELCQSCITVAQELQSALDKLAVKGDKTKWKSFRKALKSVMSKNDVKELEHRLAMLRDELNLHLSVDMKESVMKLQKDQSSRFDSLDDISEKLMNTILDNKTIFQTELGNQKRRTESVSQEQQLAKLPVAAAASFDSYERQHDSGCLPGTRIEILQKIDEWADGSSEQPIFWLSGFAGTGKSTIAHTVAARYSQKHRLAASFFFSRDIGGDVRHARKFFTTIASKLARLSHSTRIDIFNAISENGEIINQSLKDQWRRLVYRPISKMQSALFAPSLLLVVDALDECDGDDDVRVIVQLLSEARLLKHLRLRVLITSRPEVQIRRGFNLLLESEHRDFILHDIARFIVDRDILTFFTRRFQEISQEREMNDWPGADALNQLVEFAAGLFIWASIACRFIRDGRFPKKQLTSVLSSTRSSKPEKHLDQLYLTVLCASLRDDEDADFCSTLTYILGSLATLFSSLSAAALMRLLNDDDICESLDDLHSILDIRLDSEFPVLLHHPSFRDFLLDEKRCKDPRFHVKKETAHQTLAECCIAVMCEQFRKEGDICNIQRPGILATEISDDQKNALSPELIYACNYWIRHLQEASIRFEDDGYVHRFLLTHLLHWLEVSSINGKIPEACRAIIELERLITDESPRLRNFVHDARRFCSHNGSILAKAPLQVYYSALVFAPQESLVRIQFEDSISPWIEQHRRMNNHWSSSLQTLEGHTHTVRSVASSPDGRSIVSGSDDTSIKIWDVASGVLTHTMGGHTDGVRAVALSPDGRMVVSCSYDETIKLWDTAFGVATKTLQGHSDRVMSLNFSPSGARIVSGSWDQTIRIWDICSGSTVQILNGHTQPVESVAFSPDGEMIVSASLDSTVRLWIVALGTTVKILEHKQAVKTVLFSPDSTKIASSCDLSDIYLWDVKTGELLFNDNPREMYLGDGTNLAFSPDGKIIARGLTERIELRSGTSGQLITKLQGDFGTICSVSWLSSNIIAYGTLGGMIKIWDLRLALAVWSQGERDSKVTVVEFSDKDLAVLGFEDGSIWALAEKWRARSRTFNGHTASVRTIAFSPKGKMASGSSDGTVRLWNLKTGTTIGRLMDHGATVTAVVFDQETGHRIASRSDDGIVIVWDSDSGKIIQRLDERMGPVVSLALSSDGSKIAIGASPPKGGGKIRVRDTTSAMVLSELNCLKHMHIRAIAFTSSDRLITAFHNGILDLQDTTSGANLHTIKLESIINCLYFCSGKRQLTTDKGRLDIVSSSIRDYKQAGADSQLVFLEYEWVFQGGEPIMWIPHEYRHRTAASCHSNRFAFIPENGEPVIIAFGNFKPGRGKKM